MTSGRGLRCGSGTDLQRCDMAGKSPVRASEERRVVVTAPASSWDRGKADRARAVLLTLAGWTSPPMVAAVGVREDTVGLWRSDFARGGVAAFPCGRTWRPRHTTRTDRPAPGARHVASARARRRASAGARRVRRRGRGTAPSPADAGRSSWFPLPARWPAPATLPRRRSGRPPGHRSADRPPTSGAAGKSPAAGRC